MVHLSYLEKKNKSGWDLGSVKILRKGSSGTVWVLQKFHCNLSKKESSTPMTAVSTDNTY